MTFSRQKKIMLLGGSRQQVVAIEAAKQAGFYTVLCDYLQDNPGQFVADKFYQVSTTDVEALLKVAKEENIDGVLAYASDPAALPAAIVADKLRLPTNSVQCVEILGVKHKFRSFLKENGFAYPNYVSFSKDTDTSELESKIDCGRIYRIRFSRSHWWGHICGGWRNKVVRGDVVYPRSKWNIIASGWGKVAVWFV